MDSQLHGIGAMARECGLTVSALRFYDGAGVLVPAQVDPHSGYRRYGREQVGDARLLARLRRVGLPLREVRRVLEHRHDRVLVDEVLAEHLRRLEAGLADARRELSAVSALIHDALIHDALLHDALLHDHLLHDALLHDDLLDEPETRMTPTRATAPAGELLAALLAVRYAVSRDPDLPMLGGVLVEVDEEGLRMVATDRHRLAVSGVPAARVDGPPASALVPVGLVDEAVALLRGRDEPVTVELDGPDVAIGPVRGPAATHDFPDYRRVLPVRSEHRFDVDAAELRRSLAAAPTRVVPRQPDGAEQQAAVLTVSGEGAWSFTADDPGVLELGLDREFLLQALDASVSSQLVLELDGPIAPLALRDPERPGSVSLLMPIRLP